MSDLNTEVYLELADTFVHLKKFEIAKSCIGQASKNEE